MELEKLNVYKIAMELGEKIWNIIKFWDDFSNKTIGRQLIRSTDFVAANIAEGFGRYHFKENKNFLYYARGSLYETKTWIKKACNRNLIKEDVHEKLINELEKLGVKLNNYIASIGKNNH
ncbi:MAG: four helix bundle protein [Bacteroidetes bacterium]|nr:four helix bundle protein [Bacteroidota bacterium]